MHADLQQVIQGATSVPFAWGILPDGSTLPRIVLTRVSTVPDRALTSDGLIQARVQIDCYGERYGEAEGTARAVRAALDRYRGGSIAGAFLDVIRDGTDIGPMAAFRVMMTFEIHYTEDLPG